MDDRHHPRRRMMDGRSAEARRTKAVLRDLVRELGGESPYFPPLPRLVRFTAPNSFREVRLLRKNTPVVR